MHRVTVATAVLFLIVGCQTTSGDDQPSPTPEQASTGESVAEAEPADGEQGDAEGPDLTLVEPSEASAQLMEAIEDYE